MKYNINDKLQMKHDKSIKFTITEVDSIVGLYSTSLGHDYFDYELDMYLKEGWRLKCSHTNTSMK